MRNLTISIDEQTLEASRTYAKAMGMSLNALIRDLLRKAALPESAHSLEEAFALADKLKLGSKGRKWTREELYDRKVLQ